MKEIVTHIDQVYQQLQQYIKKQHSLQAKHNTLLQQAELLKTENTALKQQVETLEEQNLVLKSAMQQLGDDDKKALEKKINSFIKGLDKTIALLSS